MISKERIQSILLSKGVDLGKISKDPRVFEGACNMAYKSIPLPWRWLVGKTRVRRVMNVIKERASQGKTENVPLQKGQASIIGGRKWEK